MGRRAMANNVSLSSKCQLLECNMQIRETGLQLFNSPTKFDSIQLFLASSLQDRGPDVYTRPLSNPDGEQEGRRAPQIRRPTVARRSGSQIKRAYIAGREGQSKLQIKANLSAGWRVAQITVSPSHPLPLLLREGGVGKKMPECC